MPTRSAADVHAARAAWFTVGFGFAALALAYSIRALLGLAMPVWDDLGLWSRSWASGAGFVALAAMGLSAPLLGIVLAPIGLRRLCSVGLALLAVSCAAVAATADAWLFMLAFGVAGGLGFGILSTNVVATAVAWDFRARRGLATGIATAGSTAGQFCIVPAAAAVLAMLGWRWAFAGLAVACAVLIVPALHLPGRRLDMARPAGANIARDLKKLARNRVFHLLLWSFTICGYTTSGVIETHLLPYTGFCGIPPVPSATAYGVLSAVNLAGMIVAGWLADRHDRPRLLATIYFARAIAFLVLLQIGASFEILLVFAIAFGAVDYSTVPVTVSLAASHLGLRRLGLVVGVITAGHQFGGALGALAGGLVFDWLHGYGLLWQGSALLALGGGFLALAIGRDGVNRGDVGVIDETTERTIAPS